MKKKRGSKKAFSIAASLLMTFSLVAPNVVSAETTSKLHQSFKESTSVVAKNKVSERLLQNFKEDEQVRFLVKFKDKVDAMQVASEAREKADAKNLSAHNAKLLQRSAVVSEMKATSMESQQNVMEFLEKEMEKGNASEIDSFFLVNGIAVTATKEIAEKIATFPEVEKVLPNETRQLFTTKTANAEVPASQTQNVEWNVDRVKAPLAWAMGIDGSGTVVASIDTGVQWDHPALKEKYRGYNKATGQVSHDFNWKDTTSANRATPYDDLDHGTHVTGTMVGGEPNGSNQIGVAPGAKFIAVKAFTAAGGTDADLLEAADWIAAPTDANGNERVDMAPDVVNNSWGGGPGLDEWYRDVVIGWRALQIFPEFSAGNTTLSNPGGPGSVAAPANYPESFATGATDINNKVASFSLRGPSPYNKIKPDISAPGVNIRSSVPGGGYEGGWNGTSMAGPAVSGVAALLRQVNADITVEDMEQVLLNSATPLTDSAYPQTPNHGYGYGLVDAHSAVSSIISGLGTLKGQVTKQGDDNEAPTFSHTAPLETYEGMDLDLSISVSDNISVSSVVLNYKDSNGAWQSIEAGRTSGDYKSGEFAVKVPGSLITGNAFTYKFKINDFGNNEVSTEEYRVEVKPGITTGYFEDFEGNPTGWFSYGNANSWQHGKPTSGPGAAFSGEKVYATNLAGQYANNMNATLVMPPIDLPAGNSYLQFKHWYNFEQASSGRAWDYGTVFISTDMENWTNLFQISGISNGYLDAQVDLSAYAGQRVYIGFNAFSDGSVPRDGWYIDDVKLSNVSQTGKVTKGKNNNGNQGNNGNIGKGQDKDSLKPAVDPTKIRPTELPAKAEPIIEDIANPTLLPLGAQVSVLESGRSVYTNPADGSYSMTHAAGNFTVKAEAYGYASKEQSVAIEADGSATANFTLLELAQNTVTGSITDAKSGAPIQGATLMLMEDANIAAVTTGADGNYSIRAYEGDYTLKVIARGYHSQEVTVSIDADGDVKNIALEPFYTYPGGEIGYDDGTAENARAFYDAGNGWAVRMSLPEGKGSGIVTDGVFRFWDSSWPTPGGTAFQVEVWDASGANGAPGKKLAGPIDATALRNGNWTVVDLREHNIVVNGDFYMVYIQKGINTASPGMATDEDGKNAKRSYQLVAGAWSPSPEAEGNYMIRARVDFEVSGPSITNPVGGIVTNQKDQVIEGTASPTTTIELKQNGAEAGSVVVGNDGKFSFPVTLKEGANEFKAVSKLNGGVTGESAPVTLTLDTLKPELAITSPKNGEKTNRESVTVTGTVSDANLSWVRVNGQDAPVKDGKFSKRLLLDPGTNEITVIARDEANNRITKSVTIEADFEAPEISNLLPNADKHLVTGQTVKIEFDSEPGLRGTFVIHMPLTNIPQNATELPMMEQSPGHYVGYWTVPYGTVANGAQIEVKAVDGFGNESRELAAGKLYLNQQGTSASPNAGEPAKEEPAKEEPIKAQP